MIQQAAYGRFFFVLLSSNNGCTINIPVNLLRVVMAKGKGGGGKKCIKV